MSYFNVLCLQSLLDLGTIFLGLNRLVPVLFMLCLFLSLVSCLPRYVWTLLFIIESGGLFTTLCVDSVVYYRVRWVVYHAMCRLCSLRV